VRHTATAQHCSTWPERIIYAAYLLKRRDNGVPAHYTTCSLAQLPSLSSESTLLRMDSSNRERRVQFVSSKHNTYYSPDPTPPSSSPSSPPWTPSSTQLEIGPSSTLHDYPLTPARATISLPQVTTAEITAETSPRAGQYNALGLQSGAAHAQPDTVLLSQALAYDPSVPPFLSYDVTQSPSSAFVTPGYTTPPAMEVLLLQPATSPPVPQMIVIGVSGSLPFAIPILASSHAGSSSGAFVAVGDVLRAIYTSMLEPVSEYNPGGDISGSPTEFMTYGTGAAFVRRRADLIFDHSLFLGLVASGTPGQFRLILGATELA
jgi:hypothetical protein